MTPRLRRLLSVPFIQSRFRCTSPALTFLRDVSASSRALAPSSGESLRGAYLFLQPIELRLRFHAHVSFPTSFRWQENKPRSPIRLTAPLPPNLEASNRGELDTVCPPLVPAGWPEPLPPTLGYRILCQRSRHRLGMAPWCTTSCRRARRRRTTAWRATPVNPPEFFRFSTLPPVDLCVIVYRDDHRNVFVNVKPAPAAPHLKTAVAAAPWHDRASIA